MRTNIDIDDTLVARAMQAAGVRTKRQAVQLGLEELIRRHNQMAILELAGQVRWEGDLDTERRDIEDDKVRW